MRGIATYNGIINWLVRRGGNGAILAGDLVCIVPKHNVLSGGSPRVLRDSEAATVRQTRIEVSGDIGPKAASAKSGFLVGVVGAFISRGLALAFAIISGIAVDVVVVSTTWGEGYGWVRDFDIAIVIVEGEIDNNVLRQCQH
jgi:hypothetical protein